MQRDPEHGYFQQPGEAYAKLAQLGYTRMGSAYPWEWTFGLCDARIDYKAGKGYYIIERA